MTTRSPPFRLSPTACPLRAGRITTVVFPSGCVSVEEGVEIQLQSGRRCSKVVNFTGFVGGSFPALPRRSVPIGKDLFAPARMPLEAFNVYTRQLLVSYHGTSQGHATHRSAGGRMTRWERAA